MDFAVWCCVARRCRFPARRPLAETKDFVVMSLTHRLHIKSAIGTALAQAIIIIIIIKNLQSAH